MNYFSLLPVPDALTRWFLYTRGTVLKTGLIPSCALPKSRSDLEQLGQCRFTVINQMSPSLLAWSEHGKFDSSDPSMIEKCLGVVVSVYEVASSLENVRVWEDKCVCSTLLCHMRVSIFRLSYLNSEVIQNMAWEAIEERNIKIIWAKWWQLAQGEIEENKWWMPFHLAKPLPNEHTRWWLFSSRKLSFMNDTLKNMSIFLKTTMSRAPSVYISMCVYLLLYILNKAPSQVSQLSLTWIYHSPRSYNASFHSIVDTLRRPSAIPCYAWRGTLSLPYFMHWLA